MSITFENVAFKYNNSNNGVSNINLHIEKGEFVAVIGPSGSGKSTLLKLLAGFITPSSGKILINNQNISTISPEKRNLGIVFQSYGLFPHMSALENVAYPLKIRKLPKSQRQFLALEALKKVGLDQWAHNMPLAMSGGQQQRIALARALVFSPDALLLDEPLSALDASLKIGMRDLILEVQRQTNIATLHVTHDQEEALSIADKIAIMKDGNIIQLGAPKELYDTPINSWVASFLGQANLWDCIISDTYPNHIETPIGLLRCDTQSFKPGQSLKAMVRPEAIMVGNYPYQSDNVFSGEIIIDRFLGSTRRIDLKVNQGIIQIDTLSRLNINKVTIPADAITLLTT